MPTFLTKELIGGHNWILRLSVIECRRIQIETPFQVVFYVTSIQIS
jgi:hypothetical protein